MATRQAEYKGKTIAVDTEEVRGGWIWTYQIDAGPIRRCKDRPMPSEEIMLREGLSTAKAEMDGYAVP